MGFIWIVNLPSSWTCSKCRLYMVGCSNVFPRKSQIETVLPLFRQTLNISFILQEEYPRGLLEMDGGNDERLVVVVLLGAVVRVAGRDI